MDESGVWDESLDSCLPGLHEEMPRISIRVTRRDRPQAVSQLNHDSLRDKRQISAANDQFYVWNTDKSRRNIEESLKLAVEMRRNRGLLVRCCKEMYVKRRKSGSSYRSPREREQCFAVIQRTRLTPLIGKHRDGVTLRRLR